MGRTKKSPPVPTFKIKRTNDIEAVRLLHKKLFPGDRFYSEGLAWWLVYKNDEKPVGFCIFGEWSPGVGFLARAGLLPEARGRGLHRRMISAREVYARRNGFTHMSTYTALDSTDSSLNLKKCGYKLYQPTDVIDLVGTWLCWNKKIKPARKARKDDATTADHGTATTTATD